MLVVSVTNLFGCFGLLIEASINDLLLNLVFKIIALSVNLVLYSRHFDLKLADVVLNSFMLDGSARVGNVCLLTNRLLTGGHI